ALERGARVVVLLELVVAVADLEQRVRELGRLRVLLDDLLEFGQSAHEVALHVMRLGEPVLRVVRERALREAREKILERGRRLRTAARLHEIERRLIALLIVAGHGRRRGAPGGAARRRAAARRGRPAGRKARLTEAALSGRR